MFFLLCFIMLVVNISTILLPIYVSSTVTIIIYILDSVLTGVLWYFISLYAKNHNNYGETKAFLIPFVLIAASLIIGIVVYIVTNCMNNIYIFLSPFIYQCFMYLSLHLMHLSIQSKKGITTVKVKNTVPFITFLYFLQWICGNYYFILFIAFLSEVFSAFEGLELLITLLLVLIYLLQTFFGGIIWFLMNKYTVKKKILSAKQAFVLPVLLIIISTIMGLLIPDDVGDNILGRDFSRVISVFTQVCQFVVYLISYIINFVVIKIKRNGD